VPDPARSVRRLETATVLLLLAGAVALAIVVHDAVRFHGDAAQVETLVLALGACAGALYLGVAAGRALREARRQVALLRALSVEREIEVDGRSVTVVQGSRAAAFCGGLLHPRIYLSDAAASGLAPDELRAVVAHEAHHADRHDPLRLLVARALGGPAAALAAVRRHALLADLAADAAAVQRLGSPAPLAGALLAFDADRAGVAPERVDVLAAPGTGDAVPLAILVAAALAFALLLGAGILLVALPWHPAGSLPLCAVSAALLPALAWLAARVLLVRR
jgi:Zn-dependent protease with chaperone function